MVQTVKYIWYWLPFSLLFLITYIESFELAETSLIADSEAPANPSDSQSMKTAAARVSKILRNPDLLAGVDDLFAAALRFCLENDFLTSPAMDVYRQYA